MTVAPPRRVAIIGGGVSGALTAVHLSRLRRGPLQVAIYERADRQARGIAYDTREPGHLLNVRAANMSAFAEDPHHFEAWLDQQPGLWDRIARTASGDFVSREVYGRYVEDILRRVCLEDPGNCVSIRNADVVGIARVGEAFRLTRSDGRTDEADAIVFAMGNVSDAADESGPVFRNPWSPGAVRDLESARPVLIIGTGLSMIDTVIALRRQGFDGRIVALSRRGLLPHEHAPAMPAPAFTIGPDETPRLSDFLRRLRAAARAGGCWRSVIDSLRPVTQDLWRRLGPEAQSRFLRHARTFWDVHRHRIAQPIAEQIAAERASGKLTIIAGRIQAVTPEIISGVTLAYRPRGGGPQKAVSAQRLIVATGVPELARSRDRLVRALVDGGFARLDPLGLGFDVDDELAVIGRSGRPSPGLWALGPVVRGVFWECTAVPDIRVQAERLARRIADAETRPVSMAG